MVQIGEIVQLRIDAEVVRPMIIVSTNVTGTMNGEVFLDWKLDGSSEWVKANLFYPPHADLRSFWVEATRQGPGIGEWQRLIPPAPAKVEFSQPPARKRFA